MQIQDGLISRHGFVVLFDVVFSNGFRMLMTGRKRTSADVFRYYSDLEHNSFFFLPK